MNINIYDLAVLSKESIDKVLRRSEIDITHLIETISPIIDDVKEKRDEALIEYT